MKVHLASPYRNLTILLVGSVVFVLVGLMLTTATPVYAGTCNAGNECIDIWDCLNGNSSGPVGGCTQTAGKFGWNNSGNAGPDSHYYYGNTVPFRIEMTGLPITASTVVVRFQFNFISGAGFTWDALDKWDRTIQQIGADGSAHPDPCVGTTQDGAECVYSMFYNLPQDPSISPANSCPSGGVYAFPSGVMKAYGTGVTITDIQYVQATPHACVGSGANADSGPVDVTFTTTGGTKAILIFGLRMANNPPWTPLASTNQSPYHANLVRWSITTGGVQHAGTGIQSQQLQMKVEASPTAVTLNSLTATAQTSAGALFALAGFAGLVVVGAVVLVRRRK